MWVNISVIKDIIHGASLYGVRGDDLCKAAGILASDLDKPELKVSFNQGHLIWQEAVKLTGDELLGLHIGANTTTSIVGLVGHLMQTSSNLYEAFEHLSNYTKVITEMFFYKAEVTDEHFILYFEPSGYWQQHFPQTARQAVDQAVAGALNVCKLLTGKKFRAERVELVTVKPLNSAEYSRVLDTEVLFGCNDNKIVFNRQVAHYPVLGYNEDLQNLFMKLSNEALHKAEEIPTFSNHLRNVITAQFYNRIPQLEEMASYMNITGRTIQRRLQNEGTNFQKIADEFKKELAVRLLSINKYTVNETAYLLGYAEPSTFRRAFKRWTGGNPKSIKSI